MTAANITAEGGGPPFSAEFLNPKLQAPKKFEFPMTKNRLRRRECIAWSRFGILGLRFAWDLGFGNWCLRKRNRLSRLVIIGKMPAYGWSSYAHYSRWLGHQSGRSREARREFGRNAPRADAVSRPALPGLSRC